MNRSEAKIDKKEVIVIGAGASGLMAAIAAAQAGAMVTVLEGMSKGGRKLLLTGNGKCNLTSLDPGLRARYHSEAQEILAGMSAYVFNSLSVQDTLDFFTKEGMLVTYKGDYVYPNSLQSASVLETLLDVCARYGVKLRYSTKAVGIEGRDADGKIKVRVEGWSYSADSVILCCGSMAAPQTGSDGSGYALAKGCGHGIVPVYPALTAVNVKEKDIAPAAGARTDAGVTLWIEDPCTAAGNPCMAAGKSGESEKKGSAWKKKVSERGEVQWTADALSGIPVFQISGAAARALAENKNVRISVDLLPDYEEDFIFDYLRRRIMIAMRSEKSRTDAKLSAILSKMINSRVAEMVLARCGLNKTPVSGADAPMLRLLAQTLKQCSFTADHVRGFDQAQTCSGGVPLNEINIKTMESRICPGLYFAGEILDVDGPCGGYNLQWAWSSGYTAGRSAAAGCPL